MPQSYLNYESVLFLKVIFNNLSCEHGALSLNAYNSLETKGKMEESNTVYEAVSGHVTSGLTTLRQNVQALHRIIEKNLGKQKPVAVQSDRDSYSDSNNGHVWCEIGRRQLISSVGKPYCLGFVATVHQWHLTCRFLCCRLGSMWLGYC